MDIWFQTLILSCKLAINLFILMQIHYDGWPDEYDIWLEDSSTEIHPATWCAKTGHPLTLPLSKSFKILFARSFIGANRLEMKHF